MLTLNNAPRMNIGIDARMCGPRHGGIGRYVEQLISQLALIDRTTMYTLFVHPENPLPPLPARHAIIEAPIKWYGIREQTKLPHIFNSSDCDLIHFPHWNVPLFIKKPFITTIHDLILIHHPDRRASGHGRLAYRIKYAGFKRILNHAARRARHIITVSNFSKNDIIQTLDIDPSRITAIHLGSALPTARFEAPSSLGLQESYLLAVGVHYPHKNHHLLLDIFPHLNHPAVRDWHLVIVGPRGPFTDDLTRRIKLANDACTRKKGRVILETDRTDAQLAARYKDAQALLFPSLYEGFGLPPLEAMYHGTPVIASNTSSIPEICASGALLVDPTHPDAWIAAIETIATDKRFAQSLISRGHMRCHNFSWESCAQSTRNIYKNCSK